AGGQFTAQPVFVAGRAIARKKIIHFGTDLRPCFPVPGNRELGPFAFDIQPSTHKDIWASHSPDDCACLSGRGMQFTVLHFDVFNSFGATPPDLATELGTIFPKAVANPVRGPRAPDRNFRTAMVLEGHEVAPAPYQRFIGPQNHVHGGVAGTVAV